MKNTTQVIGMVMIVGGIIVMLLIAAWLIAGLADSNLETAGAILGGALGFLVLGLPLVGGGLFLAFRGRKEAQHGERSRRQRQLLGTIEAAGEISISDLALELRTSPDGIREDLADLVSLGLFAGYVDWDSGRLYARQASELRSLKFCENCGGELSLGGKGLVVCPYCGAEYFLP